MASTLVAVALSFNESSTSVEQASTTSGDGWTVSVDDCSKLIIQGYNSDTNACELAINAGGSPFISIGQGALSTSISSSEYRVFGPFESMRFKSTSNTLVIASTSTASTNVTLRAYLLP